MRKIKMKKLATAMAVAVTAAAVMGNPIQAMAAEFDPVFYAQTYADVAAALGTDAEALYNHYQNYGQREGRVPYAGAAAGEEVSGIAGTADTSVAATVAQTPEIDMNKTYYTMDGIPMNAAAFLQRKQEMQQKFDATGYVHVGWTEEQVYERLMWIKENLYPEGTKVGICSVGAGKIDNELYGTMWDTVVGSDGNDNWTYVDGRVYETLKARPNFNIRTDLRVGDKLFTRGGSAIGHVQIVLSHDDSGITVVESNWGDDKLMHWGRRISWSELENKGHNEWYIFHHRLY